MAISEKSNAPGRSRERTMDEKMGALSAILMPLLEFGGLGFGAYVFIYSLCIEYLLRPPSNFQDEGITPRKGAAAALITFFCIFLLIFLLTWMRLLQVIWTDPGLIPLGDPSIEKQSTPSRYFDKYDAFVSDYEGNPQYCDKCHNWKPDRTHHCRELNRCIRRMDHYCPWAGGIISETTHKFFVQLVFYGAILMVYMLIPLAFFLAERVRVLGSKPPTWIAAVALCGTFCIFSGSMFFMTIWNLSINYTTVETVQRGGIHNITMLATRTTSPPQSPRQPSRQRSKTDGPKVLREITREGREYIVFQTEPFDHPWDVNSGKNLKSVMGEHLLDWFIPLKMSPCVDHTDPKGEYEWSRVVRDMAKDWQSENPGRKIRMLGDSGRRRRSRSSKD